MIYIEWVPSVCAFPQAKPAPSLELLLSSTAFPASLAGGSPPPLGSLAPSSFLSPNPFSTPLELSPFAQDRIPSFPTHWLPGIPGYKPVPTAQCSALPSHLDLHRLFACCSLQFSLNLFFIHFPSSLIFTLLLRSCLVPVGAQVPAGLGGAAPTGSTPAQGLPCLQGRKGPKGKCEERPCETRAEKTGYISPDFFKVLVKKPSWTPWQLVRYAASAKLQVKSTYVHKFMSSQGV